MRKQVFDNDAVVHTPRNVIVYDPTWTGIVYAAESAANESALYAIEQGSSGGYATNNRVSYNFNSYLNTGYSYLNTVTAPSFSNTYVRPPVPVTVNSYVNLGSSAGATYSGDPVNMVTGNMYHNETDVDLPLKGQLRMVFQRAYNSGRAATDGPLGFGWTHSFDHALTFSDDDFDGAASASDTNNVTSGVIWTDGTGAEKHIVVTAGASAAGLALTTSAFKAPPGYHFSAVRNADGSYSIAERDGLRYTFQSLAGTVGQRARLIEIADRHVHRLTLTYVAASSSQRLVSVSDGTRTLAFGYPDATTLRIQSVTDWAGRKVQFEYDAAGDLRKAWRPGEPVSGPPGMTYDYYVAADGAYSPHQMKRFASASGEYMDFEYYSNGRTLRHRNAKGDTIAFTYNEFRRESIQVNERGHERRFFFDKNGMMIKQVEENGANREFVYGGADGPDRFNLMASVDPRGNRTEYEYDTVGNLRLTRHPSGRTMERSHFNAYGQPGKIKDARGLYALFRYDAKGNLLDTVRLKAGVGAAIDPAAHVPTAGDIVARTRHGWDVASGRLLYTTQVRDFATGEGPSVEYGYDPLGYHVNRLTRRGDLNDDGVIATSEADSADLAVDALGRVTGGIDQRWERYTTEYDDHGRVRSHVEATGSRADFRYDAGGKPVQETLSVTHGGVLRQLRSAAHEYDVAGRRVRTTGTGGAVVQFEYDAAGNLVRQTDPDGRAMVWHYDEMNRVAVVEDAEGNEMVSDLDVDGRPLGITDANGLTTRQTYWDSSRDGRLRRVEAPRASGFSGGRAVEYDYDEAGNAILVRQIGADGAGRTTLTRFDELNRPVRIAGPAVNDPVHGDIRPVRVHSYDPLGRLVEVRAGRTDAGGENPQSDVVNVQARYRYDDFGR
ncbi:MAG: DUF6531 domain-containing protein, partial [Burkholderiaceae bacterium]|nr:DUF6531 domain-containing protein [Burkholderiaceae bacterium]